MPADKLQTILESAPTPDVLARMEAVHKEWCLAVMSFA